ncbi:MAG TPA: glycosyltransferase family 2 protein [Thermoanaerobaculia bacterium]|jgi:glycosyltransferase involved in cell wall biosynthesis|nr:glycosyltransferase family 2 protein [Thermoanaerobaculia bacterium]
MSLFFPVYRDEATVERVTRKAVAVMEELAHEYEVIIVDDGSPDRAGQVADELARSLPRVRVIHHGTNRGYGAALRTGIQAARYDWICFTDGDDEYEIEDVRKLTRLRDYYDLIITFRYAKRYSGVRIFVSYVYNKLLRLLFQTRYRDISCGLRLIRKSVADELDLQSTSPFIGAEIAIKTLIKGYRVGEVGVQTFPRELGKGSSTTLPNILATIRDMLAVRRTIFSPEYDRPLNRVS